MAGRSADSFPLPGGAGRAVTRRLPTQPVGGVSHGRAYQATPDPPDCPGL